MTPATAADRRHAHSVATTLAALASVSSAILLLLLKTWAAWRTGSVAMLGSLADTGLDLVASLITLWGVRIAAVPADRNHRFGHGKAEALAALFQIALISVSAALIGWRAGVALLAGAHTSSAADGIGVSVVAIGATMGLLAYQRHVIAKTGSVAIRADYVHYQSDLVVNVSVIAALVLDRYAGLAGADAVFGILIALWLVRGAWRASAGALDQLMDKEWPEEKRRRFLEVAATHPELDGIHDLRTRSSGSLDFVQFHVWVDGAMSVAEAHRVMDEVEAQLMTEFPGIEILIHIDPVGQVDAEGVLPAEIAEEAHR